MDIQAFNKATIAEFRANNGKVGGAFAGASLLLLTTVGAKSGLARTNPLAYFIDHDRYIIMASYAGAPDNPPWYFNLLASPEVSVEVGTEQFKARAAVVPEPERTALYAKAEAMSSAFADYQRKTTRVIPVVALTPC